MQTLIGIVAIAVALPTLLFAMAAAAYSTWLVYRDYVRGCTRR